MAIVRSVIFLLFGIFILLLFNSFYSFLFAQPFSGTDFCCRIKQRFVGFDSHQAASIDGNSMPIRNMWQYSRHSYEFPCDSTIFFCVHSASIQNIKYRHISTVTVFLRCLRFFLNNGYSMQRCSAPLYAVTFTKRNYVYPCQPVRPEQKIRIAEDKYYYGVNKGRKQEMQQHKTL